MLNGEFVSLIMLYKSNIFNLAIDDVGRLLLSIRPNSCNSNENFKRVSLSVLQ